MKSSNDPLVYMLVALISLQISLLIMFFMGGKGDNPVISNMATVVGMMASGIVGYAAPKPQNKPDISGQGNVMITQNKEGEEK